MKLVIFFIAFGFISNCSARFKDDIKALENAYAKFMDNLDVEYRDDPEKVCGMTKLVLVLDESGSIGNTNWEKIANYTNFLVGKTKISPEGSRVGVVTFRSKGKIFAECDQYLNVNSLQNAISNYKYKEKGNTNIYAGLMEADKVMKNCMPGKSGKKIMVVLTDGESKLNVADTAPQAKKLQDSGVEMFSIGVGNQVSDDTLDKLASSSQHKLRVATFSDLVHSDAFNGKLAAKLCPPPTTAPTTAPTTKSPTTKAPTTTPTTTRAPTTTPTTTKEPTTTTEKPVCCNCTVESEPVCLSWGEEDIYFYFKGLCFADKLKLAVEYVKKQIDKITKKSKEIKEICLPAYEKMILDGQKDVFQQYKECLNNLQCVNKDRLRRLGLKLEQLNRELAREEEKKNSGFLGKFLNGVGGKGSSNHF